MSSKKQYLISAEGLIGGGKTTLIKALLVALRARGLEAVYIPEPVDEWRRVGALQRFYKNSASSQRGSAAYEFQSYTFTTRIQATLLAVEAAPSADVFVTERTVLTDRFIFMELQRDLVGTELMQMYEQWWALYNRLMPLNLSDALYIYLRPSLATCMDRTRKRAREGEVQTTKADDKGAGGVSLEYQDRLMRAHEAFFRGVGRDAFPGMPPAPFDISAAVLVIDNDLADGDFTGPGEVCDEIVLAFNQKLTTFWPELRGCFLDTTC